MNKETKFKTLNLSGANKPKDVLLLLNKYLNEMRYFGTADSEPTTSIYLVLAKFETLSMDDSLSRKFELYSSVPGNELVAEQIAKAVNLAIEQTRDFGFGGMALADLWREIKGIEY